MRNHDPILALLPVLLLGLTACGGPDGTRSGSSDEVHPGPDAVQAPSSADHGSHREGSARVSAESARRIDLRFGTAEPRPLARTIRTSGSVGYAESEMRWVSPKVRGWIDRLHVTYAGAPVQRGEPLLSLYSPEMVSAQKELLLARRLEGRLRASGAGTGRDSLVALARRRLAYWDVSQGQIDRLLESGEIRKTMTLHAPFSGVVMEKRVFEGQGVDPGENLMMIAPLDPIWIEVAIYGPDLPFVGIGTEARVSVEGRPGETFRGRISYLYPELESATRTVRARIEVRNRDRRLRPGMFASVQLTPEMPTVLTVPSSAIYETGTREVVFLRRDDGALVPRRVRTGRRGDDHVEVLEGVEEGDRVATSAQFLLDSEANLAEAMQAMAAEMGGDHAGHEPSSGKHDGGH